MTIELTRRYVNGAWRYVAAEDTGATVLAKSMTFRETPGAGTYTGSFTLPVDAIVVAVLMSGLGFESDSATLNVGDHHSLDAWISAFDVTVGGIGPGDDEELNGLVYALGYTGSGSTDANLGTSIIHYPEGDTIVGTLVTTGAGGDSGIVRIVLLYVSPTDTAAAKS